MPDGYYMSSVYGDNFIGWHVNRGEDLTPDFYRAVQFDRILYRPDVVSGAFQSAGMGGTRSLASTLNADFQIAKLREIAPPRLRLTTLSVDSADSGKPQLKLKVEGEKSALGIRDYSVFVNGIPVTPSRERHLAGRDAEHFSRTVQIDLSAHDNEIRVEAFNGVSMGIAETYVPLPGKVSPAQVSGDLYMLAVGANAFPGLPKRMHLSFAAQDADEIGKALQLHGLGNYKQVHVNTLSDVSAEKPDRATILSALQFAEQAGPNDTVVIFLASHGISDQSGNYYFVPRDVQLQDIAMAQKGEEVKSLISWTAFFDALRGVAGRRVLIVDTCHAKNIEGSFEAHSLLKRSASSQFALIVAAKGNEESQEYSKAKHGLFTYSLLSAMNADSDKNHDGVLSLQEIFDAALPLVDSLRFKQAGPQTPQMVAPQVLSEMPVMKAQVATP